jgi:hypothetical protein
MTEMITWGILIYNKNNKDINTNKSHKSLFRIKRSKNNIFQNLLKKKKDIVKKYFMHVNDCHYKWKDIVLYAYYMKSWPVKENLLTVENEFLCSIIFKAKKFSNCKYDEIEGDVNIIQN